MRSDGTAIALQDGAARGALLKAALLFAVNAVFASALCVNALYRDSTFAAYWVVYSFALCALIQWYAGRLASGRTMTLMNVFLAYYFAYFMIGTVLIITDVKPAFLFGNWTLFDLNYALIVILIAEVSAINGYMLASGRFVSRIPGNARMTADEGRIKAAIVIMAAVSFVLMLAFIRSMGGAGYLVRMGQARLSEEFLGKAIYSVPMTALANMSVFMAMRLKKGGAVILPLAANAFMADLVSGFRINIAFLLVGMAIVRHVMRPLRLKARHLVWAGIIILLIGPVPQALRGGYGKTLILDYEDLAAFAIEDFTSGGEIPFYTFVGRWTGADSVMAITSKLRETGEYMYGGFFLPSLALGFIPRAVWPGRSAASSWVVNEYFWPGVVEDVGAPNSTMVGEVYWEGGVVATVVVFFLFGAVLKGIERYRDDSGGEIWTAVLYALFLWYWCIMSSETMVSSFGSWLIYAALWAFLYRATGRRVGGDAAGGTPVPVGAVGP
jgi:oligosaccharide repeat unit polymerase